MTTTALDKIVADAKALVTDERDWLANSANVAALAFSDWNAVRPADGKINWFGFYFARADDGSLVLGPFGGQPACIRIALERGVCGRAARERTTQLIRDVHAEKDHIACDHRTEAELVVPLVRADGRLIGVLDVDALAKDAFSPDEVALCEQLAALLVVACDWSFLD